MHGRLWAVLISGTHIEVRLRVKLRHVRRPRMSVCHLTMDSSALSVLRVLVARGFDLDTLSNYQHEDDNLEVTSHTCLSLVLWRRPLEPCIHSCHLEQTPMDHLASISPSNGPNLGLCQLFVRHLDSMPLRSPLHCSTGMKMIYTRRPQVSRAVGSKAFNVSSSFLLGTSTMSEKKSNVGVPSRP